MKINCYFMLLSIIALAYSRLLEVTSTNIHNIFKLQTKTFIKIIFYHPQSSQSILYKQLFTTIIQQNNIKQQYNHDYGLLDCHQQSLFCKQHQIDHYPQIIKIQKNQKEDKLTIVRQQAQDQSEYQWNFLFNIVKDINLLEKQHSILKQIKDSVALHKCLNLTKNNYNKNNKIDDLNYCVVVLQEQGLPTIDKLQQIQQEKQSQQSEQIQRIFYLQPSKLANILKQIIGKSYGCWILKYEHQQLIRYSCGIGDNPHQILQNIKLLKYQKLSPTHLSSQNSQFRSKQDLSYQHFVKFLDQPKQAIIYFYSQDCPMCFKDKDIQLITLVVKKYETQNKQEAKKMRAFKILSYNLNQNQLPIKQLKQKAKITISKLPTVLMFDIKSDAMNLQYNVVQLKQVINVQNMKAMFQKYFEKIRSEIQKKEAQENKIQNIDL